MTEAVRKAYQKFAKVLDQADADCRAVEAKDAAGERLTSEETVLLERWRAEGRKPWRQKRKVVLKIRRAAKMAAKNT